MNSGGTIEIAQRIAEHTSPSTTRIYDRSGDRLTLEEIERVQMERNKGFRFRAPGPFQQAAGGRGNFAVRAPPLKEMF